MTLYRVKLGRTLTFMKYLASLASLKFLPKTLIRNKIKFPYSNSLNLAELLVNKLTSSISKNITKIPFFLSDLLLLKVGILRAYN